MFVKYLESEHAKSLLTEGRLRLGTLSSYRDAEKDNEARADCGEGVKTLLEHIPELVLTGTLDEADERNRAYVRDRLGIALAPGATAQIANCVVSDTYKSSDCWIYCVSNGYDGQVMTDFDCDSAVVITNPHKFFEAISRDIASDVAALPLSLASTRHEHSRTVVTQATSIRRGLKIRRMRLRERSAQFGNPKCSPSSRG